MQQHVTTIQGERVLLRPPQAGDADESARVWTPELRHMYGGSLTAPGFPTVESRRTRFQRALQGEEGHFFCVEADGRYIGFAILDRFDEPNRSARYRIGIENPEYWGKGCGTEVTRLLLRYVFETLAVHRVSLRVAAYNSRAIRCYEKCGFRLEGVERDSFFVDGEWHDDLLMAILQEEWRERAGAEAGGESGIRIRSYRAPDYEQVIALWRGAGFNVARKGDTREAIAHKLAHDRGPFLVAELGGRVIGTAIGSWDGRWAWVYRVAVDPGHQRQGVGRRLMAEVERRLAALGVQRIHLLTGKQNQVAARFYQHLGYELADDIAVMRKALSPEESRPAGGAR